MGDDALRSLNLRIVRNIARQRCVSFRVSWIFLFHISLQDRKHHRPYCKPDATESSVRSNGDANAAAVEREPGPQKEAPSSGGFQPGPERTIGINIGGQTFRISSTTMDPQFLRWVREEVEKLAAANGLNFL